MSVTPPGEPSDLKLLDSTNTTATLGWKESDLPGGSDIIGYEIEMKQVRMCVVLGAETTLLVSINF